MKSKSKYGLIALFFAAAIFGGCDFHDDQQVAWYSTPTGTVFSIYSTATSDMRYHLNQSGEGKVRDLFLGGDYDNVETEDFLTGPSTADDSFFFYTRLAASVPGDCVVASAAGWFVVPATSEFCEVGISSWPQ